MSGTIDKSLFLCYSAFVIESKPPHKEHHTMIKILISRIRTSLNTFIKKHIVDDEHNIWPNGLPDDLR